MADADPFFQFHIEKGLDMLFGEHELADAQARLDALGRDGWQLVTDSGPFLIFQRLVVAEPRAEAARPTTATVEPTEDPEQVDPYCGCGCGDAVLVTKEQYRASVAAGMHWYAAGHGQNAFDHEGDYMDKPLRERSV